MPEEIHEEALAQMRARAGTWAAYENQALDSSQLGHLRFLAYGEGKTFAEPPKRYPDTPQATGWAYVLVGTVNLDSGDIVPCR